MNKSPEVERFYVSWKWRKFRENRMKLAGGLCEECRAKGKVVPAEEVHHIVELTAQNVTDPRIALSVENTACLCKDCHKAKRIKKQQKRWHCDPLGRVTI